MTQITIFDQTFLRLRYFCDKDTSAIKNFEFNIAKIFEMDFLSNFCQKFVKFRQTLDENGSKILPFCYVFEPCNCTFSVRVPLKSLDRKTLK